MSGETIAILGAGAFGRALSTVATAAGCEVILWHRGDMILGDHADAAGSNATIGEARIVLFAVPAQATRECAERLEKHIESGTPLLACAKGIEAGTGMLQTDILAEILGGSPVAALSGPGFADEIAAGKPTAVTIAASDIGLAHTLCHALSSETFRPYASDDPIGVQLGGALKNVLAIACGIVAGKKLGESARAALVARGLSEMTRVGMAMGARRETFMGLSGLGDLVLTATSARSRNLSFGVALGEGRSVADLVAAGAPLSEGSSTAQIAATLARRHGVEAPIIEAVAAIIDGAITVDEAIDGLVSRPLKAENA